MGGNKAGYSLLSDHDQRLVNVALLGCHSRKKNTQYLNKGVDSILKLMLVKK